MNDDGYCKTQSKHSDLILVNAMNFQKEKSTNT